MVNKTNHVSGCLCLESGGEQEAVLLPRLSEPCRDTEKALVGKPGMGTGLDEWGVLSARDRAGFHTCLSQV